MGNSDGEDRRLRRCHYRSFARAGYRVQLPVPGGTADLSRSRDMGRASIAGDRPAQVTHFAAPDTARADANGAKGCLDGVLLR